MRPNFFSRPLPQGERIGVTGILIALGLLFLAVFFASLASASGQNAQTAVIAANRAEEMLCGKPDVQLCDGERCWMLGATMGYHDYVMRTSVGTQINKEVVRLREGYAPGDPKDGRRFTITLDGLVQASECLEGKGADYEKSWCRSANEVHLLIEQNVWSDGKMEKLRTFRTVPCGGQIYLAAMETSVQESKQHCQDPLRLHIAVLSCDFSAGAKANFHVDFSSRQAGDLE